MKKIRGDGEFYEGLLASIRNEPLDAMNRDDYFREGWQMGSELSINARQGYHAALRDVELGHLILEEVKI